MNRLGLRAGCSLVGWAPRAWRGTIVTGRGRARSPRAASGETTPACKRCQVCGDFAGEGGLLSPEGTRDRLRDARISLAELSPPRQPCRTSEQSASKIAANGRFWRRAAPPSNCRTALAEQHFTPVKVASPAAFGGAAGAISAAKPFFELLSSSARGLLAAAAWIDVQLYASAPREVLPCWRRRRASSAPRAAARCTGR